VFISYGDPSDPVTALPLQALGAANGLHIYVPPAHTRIASNPAMNPDVANSLARAQVVLGIIPRHLSNACHLELQACASAGKRMIVMTKPAVQLWMHPSLVASYVPIDPINPAEAEGMILKLLKKMSAEKEETSALLALGTIELGLVLLANADK
jgi:hypothetical protein